MAAMNIEHDTVTTVFADVGFDDLFGDLVKEIELLNYRITRIYDINNMNERMESISNKSIGFQHYKIIEFCNLMRCSEMIPANLLVGVFFPVKFLVYQELGSQPVKISYLKPTAIARLFSSAEITKSSALMEEDMKAILAEIDF